ncbi:hypothetical protein [Tahibacter sp.]|uniref:beta family protein n=1 Tax=Tahibacter sp. TaxID=2056211 RepID=UPI0028C4E339|nr:hypothetical protein [Tahibacter sp.]
MNLHSQITKLKPNDVQSFNLLERSLRKAVHPIFEMLLLPSNAEDADVRRHLYAATEALASYQDGLVPTVDLDRFPPDVFIHGKPASIVGYENLYQRRMRVIPVVALHADTLARARMAEVAEAHGQGLCIRLLDEDIMSLPEQAAKSVTEIVRDVRLNISEVDILLDCAKLGRYDDDHIALSVIRLLMFFNRAGIRCRRITFAGSSIPKLITEVVEQKHSHGAISRAELAIWTRICRAYGWGRLGFADYGIVRPGHTDSAPVIHINGKLRYTVGAKTHFFRGCSRVELPLADQYPDIVKAMVGSGHYLGPAYSHADKYYRQVADDLTTTGNTGKWVTLDMNHHLAYVSRQLSALVRLPERELSSAERVESFIESFA